MGINSILRYANEFKRALRNHKYEMSPAGIVFPEAKLVIGGKFGVSVNDGPVEWSDNLIVDQALNDLLDVYFHNQAQITTWYVAPFKGNVTPQATWTAANFTANATEATEYDETTRIEWVEGAATAKTISNTASKAVFTMNATVTIYGAALISASAKSAITGKLAAASRFSTQKDVGDDDLLNIAYSISASST